MYSCFIDLTSLVVQPIWVAKMNYLILEYSWELLYICLNFISTTLRSTSEDMMGWGQVYHFLYLL